MNKWLSDDEIDIALCHGPLRASETKVRIIARQAKESNRLRAGLETAYREGWSTGYHAGLSDGHPLNSPRCDEDQDWDSSDTRQLLEGDK